MPYDEDGNWIDPEESDVLTPEGEAQVRGPNDQNVIDTIPANSDMAEYLRRARVQGAVATAEPKTFQAPAIGPEESKYRQIQSQTPLKENFRPSGLRKALGFIGGAVSGNPDVREGITDYAYRKAQGDFQQKLGVQGSKATQEEADVQRAAVQGHLGAQSAAELARRQAEISRGGYYDWRSSPTAHQYKMEELGVQHKTTAEEGPYEAKLKDGSTVDLVRTPSGLWKNPENGMIISREAIDQISEKGKSIKSSNQFTGVLAEDVAAHKVVSEETAKPGTHDPAVVEAAKAYIKNREQGKDPTNAYADVVRTMEESGKKLTADQKIKIAHAVQPEQKPPQALVMPPAGGAAMVVKPGTVVPPGMVTPTQAGQEQVATDKDLRVAMKARRDLEASYHSATALAAHPTATNDLALMFQYLGAIKPEALGKLRLNNNEINLVEGTRSLLGDVDAKIAKIKAGELLTPDQRQSMLNTMKTLAGMDEGAPSNPGGVPKPGEMFNGHKVTKVTEIHK